MTYLAERENITIDDAYRLAAEHVPLRRVAEPEEIASVCAFLSSPDASIVTGHVVADGSGSAVDPATIAFDRPNPRQPRRLRATYPRRTPAEHGIFTRLLELTVLEFRDLIEQVFACELASMQKQPCLGCSNNLD